MHENDIIACLHFVIKLGMRMGMHVDVSMLHVEDTVVSNGGCTV